MDVPYGHTTQESFETHTNEFFHNLVSGARNWDEDEDSE